MYLHMWNRSFLQEYYIEYRSREDKNILIIFKQQNRLLITLNGHIRLI